MIYDFLKRLFSPKNVSTRDSFGSTGNLLSGQTVTDKTAMAQAAVYACVRLISNSVASLPIKVYQRSPQGDRDLRVDHPLMSLLAYRPNPWQSSYEYREMMGYHVALRGEHLSKKIFNNAGRLAELHPIAPGRFSVSLNADMTDILYTVTLTDGKTEILTKEEVFHVRGLYSDILTPITPIQYAMKVIGLDQAMLSHEESTFGPNAAHPGGVIEADKAVRPETADRIMNLFNKKFGGSGNARKTMLLEDGMSFRPLQMTNADAQFIETRKFSVSDICRIFNVPESLIHQNDNSTYSNAEQQSFAFLKFSLMPYLQRIQQAIYRDLLLPSQVGKIEVDFDTKEFLRGDNKTTAEYLQKLVYGGIATPNEARAFLGLDKYDDEMANKLFIQRNTAPIDEPVEQTGNNAQEDTTPQEDNVLNFVKQLEELRK